MFKGLAIGLGTMDFEKLGYEDLLNRLSSYNENTDKDILDRFNFWIDEHYKILVCGRGNTGQLVAEYIKKRDKSVEFVDSDFFIDKSWREDRTI